MSTTMQQQTILHTLQWHITASPQATVITTVYITTKDHITAMPNFAPVFTFKHILSHFQYWEGTQLQTQHTFTQKSRTQQWPINWPISQLEPSSIQKNRWICIIINRMPPFTKTIQRTYLVCDYTFTTIKKLTTFSLIVTWV